MATYTFKIPQAMHQMRFDQVAHALLNEKIHGGVSKAQVRKLIMVGAAYLNGKRCRIASKPAWAGNELRVEYNPQRIAAPVVTGPFDPASILFNECGLIVVDKPAGLPTVATLDNARDNLVAQLEKHFGYIGVHHRLDAPTSGLILFTTSEEMNVFAARLFQENLIQKTYLAIVSFVHPPKEKKWEIKNQLARTQKKRNIYASTVRLSSPQAPVEGSFAHSRFEILELRDNLALVRAEPVTGRTHQLRVHLAEYGLPVLGDRTYAPDGPAAERLMLHAHRLAFRHMTEAREVTVEAPVQAQFKKLFGL